MEETEKIGDILDEKFENLKNGEKRTKIEQFNEKDVVISPEDIVNKTVEAIEGPAKKWGGSRAGAGMPKGTVTKRKKTANEARAHFINRVHEHVDELFNAQLQLAKGETVVMVKVKERDGKGSVKKIYHDMVTDPETIKQVIDNEYGTPDAYDGTINDEDHYYYVVTKPANNQAIEGMLNRAYGKAPEKLEIEGGFFKADNLNINIIKPQESLDEPQEENIE